MHSLDIIGKVAARYLAERITEDEGDSGTARYVLDCMTAEQTAAVAREIISNKVLHQEIEIKLPKHFLEHLGLPDEILTNERATYYRNAECEKSALLIANIGDDEEQSLKELVPIGQPQLMSHPELWVECASNGLSIPEDHQKWWRQALKGLIEARPLSLTQLSDYIAATRVAIDTEGQPIRTALGQAQPVLRLPKDSHYFNSLNDKNSGHLHRWRKLYNDAFKKRGCYLVKQTPTQSLLDEETLRTSFEKVKETSIPEDLHPLAERFIKAPSGWNAEAIEVANCEWELVKPLFDGLKREKFNLGKETHKFYEEWDIKLLTDDEIDYLERLSKRRTTQADEEDEQFYSSRRLELKESPKLKNRWDRFIYGSPIESEDFIAGIAQCLQALFDQDFSIGKRRLTIGSDKCNKRDLKQINRDAGLHFAFRYRGLRDLFGKSVTWEMGDLPNYNSLDEEWRTKIKKHKPNRSVAKAALQIKFYLNLEVETPQGTTESYSKQLIWKYNPNAISSEMHDDWGRLAHSVDKYKSAIQACSAHRESVSGKGKFQSIDLQDVRTLLPTYDKDRGSLVAVYDRHNDIDKIWSKNLKEAVESNHIGPEIAKELESGFEDFSSKYAIAIQEFLKYGLGATKELLDQHASYTALLNSLCTNAKGDTNREKLLRPLLAVGSVPVEGGPVASITAPWHPLRMAAIANKALQVSGLVKHLIKAESVFFGDTKLYFEELDSELTHPFYPEVVLGWMKTRPELLVLTDHHLDYSLHEPAVAPVDVYADTNENPTGSALRIIDIMKRYLALHPHEQANLSVVLYNCDSARLPQAIVDKVQELHETDDDLRCEVKLRHRESSKLRDLYERIIESSDNDADSFVASEATRDFMARLRIGIMADQAPAPDEADGPPTDVVFLQDVIARHAELEWYTEDATPVSWAEWVPSRWSRRRPAASDDLKSVVYLCCPVASEEGWDYLTAVTTFFKGDWDGDENRRLLPARQLNFNDPTTKSIFQEIHNLGNWVVNYDELLDRRQLVNQHVKVIRYKQTDTQGRNMLISSNCSTSLLRRMVEHRLKNLNLGLSEEDLSSLAKKFIDDANLVSGDLVLRAAKRGKNASELIGVVLSKYLINREIGEQRLFGWYLLDDYSDWLGQREEQIADILALSPEIAEDGSRRLAVVISEAKYIDHAGLSSKRKESQKQLRQTVDRIEKALFGDPGRLDRDIWLGRFSDMVLNGIQFPANEHPELSKLRREIRDGECSIYLRGYSHVFVSGPVDSPECSEMVDVAETENSYQEVYSRAKLRDLVLHYWNSSDPSALRREVADGDIWSEKSYQRPSDRVKTLIKKEEKPASQEDNPEQKEEINDPTPIDKPLAKEPVEATEGVPLTPPDTDDLEKLSTTTVSSYLPASESSADTEEDRKWLKSIESRTKSALQQFQLQSKLIESTLTPNAALLKFQGSANLTVDHVLKRQSQFLTTHGLNLISVRAEPGIVSMAVSRDSRRVLKLQEAWDEWSPDCENGNQEIVVGVKEDDGSLLVYSPRRHAPHALIAGSTGSGKSVLTQNIILSLAATNTPEQAKIMIIDPKQVDYLAFSELPHVEGGIIDEQSQAIAALNSLIEEMDRRYALLKAHRVNNIFDLYKKEDASEKPPVLWVIHDEFAEWMMTDEYKEAVSKVVSRLGVKARAAGIFLIFAAQRPDNSVMPMQLRSNLGNRMILKVDSEGTSEVSLGEKGAERLLGKGHMCAKLDGENGLIYSQVPFLSSEEISAAVGKIEAIYRP